VTLDDVPEAILLREVGRAFVDHHRRTRCQRTVNDIRVARHPADVCRAPVDVGFLQIEHPLACGVALREVTAGRVDDALRLAGRAGGVERVEQLFGVDPHRLAIGGCGRHQLVVPAIALGMHGQRLIQFFGGRAAHHDDDMLDRRAVGDRGVGRLLERNDGAAAIAGRRGDEQFRAGILDAIAQSFGGESSEDDGVCGADACTGQHGYDGFRDERQIDGDAIAGLDAERFQDVREFRYFDVKLAVGEAAEVARFTFPDDRGLVAARCEMAIDAVVRRVQRSADEPLRVGRIPVENLLPFRLPVELLGPAGPELLSVLRRLRVDRSISNIRLFAEFVRRRELAVFLKKRVDLVRHDPRILAAWNRRHMKKLFGGIAVAVVLLCGAMWVAGVAAHRAFDPRPWPANLGLLADAPAHFPDVETNPAAQALTELTPPLGFSITPKLPALQQPKVGNDWEAIKEPVNKYFHDELERTNEQIAPPPANVAAYLNDHRAQIDRARDHILNAGPIVWVTHFRMGADAPLPNLLGQMNLSKLLAARALMKASAGDATAWDDLHAIWLLDRELWQRPELISQLIALAGARMVNASAAKMPLPAPQWLAEIQSFDYRQHFAASHQAEAYFMTHEWRKEPGRFKALQSLYFEVAASSAAEKM